MNARNEYQSASYDRWSAGKSFAFFLIPGILMALGMWFASPWLIGRGIPQWAAVFVSLWSPVIVMSVIVLWRSIGSGRGDLRIGTLTGNQLIAVALGFVIVQILELVMSRVAAWVGPAFSFVPTAGFPALLLPGYVPVLPIETFFGLTVRGNPGVFFFWILWLVVNIGGEEILWRGYALPRMERAFGKWAWLVNGLCWNILIHAFMPWAWITLLPVSLVAPYLAQRFRSIWPSVCIHGIGNLLVFVVLIFSQ